MQPRSSIDFACCLHSFISNKAAIQCNQAQSNLVLSDHAISVSTKKPFSVKIVVILRNSSLHERRKKTDYETDV